MIKKQPQLVFNFTNYFYGIIKLNVCLILTNGLLIGSVILFKFTWNNLWLYLLPLGILICSLKAGFLALADLLNWQDEKLIRGYLSYLKITFKSSLKLYLSFLPLLLLLWGNLMISLTFKDVSFMKIPLLITLAICLTGLLNLLVKEQQSWSMIKALKEGLSYAYRHLGVVILSTLSWLAFGVLLILYPFVTTLLLPGILLTVLFKLVQRSQVKDQEKLATAWHTNLKG